MIRGGIENGDGSSASVVGMCVPCHLTDLRRNEGYCWGMIRRLEQGREVASRLIVSGVIIAAISKDHVFHQIEALSLTLPEKTLGLIYVVALIFLDIGLEAATDFAIDSQRWVRRLIMGSQDIEGYWLDVVYHSDRIISGGLVRYFYEDRTYKVSGRDFDEAGQWFGWWESEISAYEAGRLDYKFRALRPGGGNDATGHGENHFSSNDRELSRQYDGYYFEGRNDRRFYVHGERLEDFLKSQKLSMNEALKAVRIPGLVKAFVESRKPALPLGGKKED